MTRPLAFLLAGSLVLAPATARADAAGPTINVTITSGTAGDNGWYLTSVTVGVQTPGATSTTCLSVYTFTATNDSVDCTATEGLSTVSRHIQYRIDKAAPTVSAAADRAPDGGGWYTHAVTVVFSGTDADSGIAGCTTAGYAGPDASSANVTGTCRDRAGNTSAPLVSVLRYDATAPGVTASTARSPDAGGWFNHPVAISFAGTDAGSGIASCDPTTSYGGPDSAEAKANGSCRDAAGNTGSATLGFKYDATAPRLTGVRAETTGDTATLHWEPAPDVAEVVIERAPGKGGRAPSTIFAGTANAFRDRHLRTGVRYRYTLRSSDVAGNVASTSLEVSPRALYAPPTGARVRAGEVLRWVAAPRTSYYNLQLFRNSKKVLSTWPRTTRYALPQRWHHGGKAQRLVAGHYRWYVWPGRGARAANRYGPLLGSSEFLVR